MLEYHVGGTVFTDFDKAAGRAVSLAASGRPTTIDVIAYSVEDAMACGGDEAVERYLEDPDASVFDRIIVKAESIGMVH